MPSVRCPCGTPILFPTTDIGKRRRCALCGRVVVLSAPRQPEEPPDAPAREIPAPTGQAESNDIEPFPDSGSRATIPETGEVELLVDARSSARGYSANLVQSALFATCPSSLVTFVAVWVVLSFAALLSRTGPVVLIIWIVLYMWYCAFRLNVLHNASGGELELADARGSVAGAEDFISGMSKWLGCWAVALLPAFALLAAQAYSTRSSVWYVYERVALGVEALVLLSPLAVGVPFAVAAALGAFCWPLIVLCVAIGGFSTLLRPDLMFRTLIRTFPEYQLTVALLCVAYVIKLAGTKGLMAWMGTIGPAGGGAATWMSGAVEIAAIVGLNLYVDIVAMQLVGLYYHHFKDDFAWSWE